MIETGGGVSGAMRSLCSASVPLRANRSAVAIAFGSCLLRYMAATSAVKLSKRLEVVINCWCCDCWLPSGPQSQLTSPSQGREHLPKSGRLLPLNLRQQHTTCLATYLDLVRSNSLKSAVHHSECHQIPARGRTSGFCSVRRAVTCDNTAMARSNNATCMEWLTTCPTVVPIATHRTSTSRLLEHLVTLASRYSAIIYELFICIVPGF